ncbi:helix-turn-helix transcriptional regulator [Oceanobacillus kapialis]|uniref:Helix-turn-helix transcriptional regulator n=1 Tax=Oceanobacillus kapialis TaxID=481353 RepID=A0ABW5Q2S3_9BACI
MKNNIRVIRKAMKFSQEELASMCGVTRQTINAIENNKYDPTLTLAFKLSQTLNTTVDQLFIFEEDTKD